MKKYKDNYDIRIYTIFNGINGGNNAVRESTMEEKGSMKTSYNYNDTAITEIQNYMIDHTSN